MAFMPKSEEVYKQIFIKELLGPDYMVSPADTIILKPVSALTCPSITANTY